MSRNGSGTYTLPAGNPVVTGTTITTTWANTTLSDIASSLTGSVAADGQTPMTGALNMASNKITSVTDPTNAQDAATKAYVDASIPSVANFLTKTNNLSDVTSATTSRTNLSAAKSGANSDITSLTGLTTALTVSQGGTGSATLTANNVLLGNGTSALQAVAPGTSGNVLTSNGTTWTSAPISGKVLQVVSTSLTSIFSSSSTSYADVTGLSVSITPTSTSSKILVRVDITGGASSLVIYQIVRGSTAIGIGDLVSGHGQSTMQPVQWQGSNSDRGYYSGMTYLDSPATTSSTTYKIQGLTDSGTWYVNRSANYTATTVGTGSISTITVMEIAG